jgi:hypothetical protein
MNLAGTQRSRSVFKLGALLFAGAVSFAPVVRGKDCGNGVTLSLSAPETAQGSLLLAEVSSRKPLGEVTGKWNDKDVPFWKSEGKRAVETGDLRKALLGVDLEKPAGKYSFEVSVEVPGSDRVNCNATIRVEQGHFATENLTVKREFVEPNPEQVARAERDTKKLREIYDTVTPEKLWNGKFRVPLDGEYKGTNFGKRRVLNGNPGSPHSGVDFPAATGTPVYAAQSGRVVLAEDLFFSGNTVVVDHGLGIHTFYCHFSEIDVTAGGQVKKGDLLGKVGATGRVTGPHLHWGLNVERARVNALDIVKLLGIS